MHKKQFFFLFFFFYLFVSILSCQIFGMAKISPHKIFLPLICGSLHLLYCRFPEGLSLVNYLAPEGKLTLWIKELPILDFYFVKKKKKRESGYASFILTFLYVLVYPISNQVILNSQNYTQLYLIFVICILNFYSLYNIKILCLV